MTHNYHPEPNVHISIFTLDPVHSIGLGKHLMMCMHQWSTLQWQFHCPKISLLCLVIHPSPQSLETSDLFTLSIVLPFLECQVVGITQYLAFSDLLLSLKNIHLRFPHGLSFLASSLLFSTEYYSIIWMYHVLFIHSSTIAHLGCCQILEL